jgi:hypothetical protein
MKNIIIVFALTLIAFGCNKNNGNSGGGTTPTSPNKDVDNFITIDGVTNYHYSRPTHPLPTASCGASPIVKQIYWSNINELEQDYTSGLSIMIQLPYYLDSNYHTTIGGTHQVNGVKKGYSSIEYITKSPLLTDKIVNGNYVWDLKNIKVYEGDGKDTTRIFKYLTGRVTCNGK